MWSMSVVLIETVNENDSENQNDVAKMSCHDVNLQNDVMP